jgi:K+-sensing histidine kinase KdpD
MYSSHSGTPVSGAVPVFAVSVLDGAVVLLLVLAVAVVLAVFAGLLAAALFEVVFVAPPQPNETNAKHAAAAIAKKLLIVIILIFLTENNFLRLSFANERNEDKKHLRLFKRKVYKEMPNCWTQNMIRLAGQKYKSTAPI